MCVIKIFFQDIITAQLILNEILRNIQNQTSGHSDSPAPEGSNVSPPLININVEITVNVNVNITVFL